MKLADLQRAVARLREALQAGSDNSPLVTSLLVDASILRFEICVELAWKAMQGVLERDHGVSFLRQNQRYGKSFGSAW